MSACMPRKHSGKRSAVRPRYSPHLNISRCNAGFFLPMSAVVYIIYSEKLDRFYTGYTTDLAKRLQEHNSGISNFTAKASDWKLMYTETFQTREEAQFRERQIKNKKSRKYITYLIESK